MPNAMEAHRKPGEKFLVLGQTGSGKTTLFTTLPGKKFMYLFDPNALNSIQGLDIDYEEFLPDMLNMAVGSLSKGKGDRPTVRSPAVVYSNWEKDFESKMESGFFDSYDCVGFDSFTTLSDMVMDRVLEINGRGGQWPQMDDYGPQMNTLLNIVRTVTAMGKIIYFTGHVELKQDELTSRIYQTPMMTGRLKAKLPLLFSEIYMCKAEPDTKGNVKYQIQTKPDRLSPLVRCTLKGLELYQDVTIDYDKPLDKQGLGKILKEQK